jgi:threonine dehydrogenase-like Zn-dependent dehydrogenase
MREKEIAQALLLLLASSWGVLEVPGLLATAKEIGIAISTMYGQSGMTRDADAALLGQDKAVADALVRDRFPLSLAPAAFERSRDRRGGTIEVVLEPRT